MKGKEISQLIEELDMRCRLGWHVITVHGGVDDFLANYKHGPKHNILGNYTFRRKRGVMTIDDKERIYAIFERVIIAGFKAHIGTLFVVEDLENRITLAIEI